MRTALFLILAVFWGSSAQGALPSTCSTRSCHATFRTFAYQHGPVTTGCLYCHELADHGHPLIGQKSMRLKEPEPALCYRCHDRFGKKKVLHGILEGDGKCTSCHRVHGSNTEHLLPDSKEPFCYECHDRKEFTTGNIHGPTAVGECVKCHEPHEGDVKALLKAPVPNLCFACHSDFAEKGKESAHTHTPVKKDGCMACHVPHSGKPKYLLKNDSPKLCTDCHKKIAASLPAKEGHEPVVKGKGCSNCHQSHFSQAKALLPYDEKELCLSCHGKSTTIKGRKGNILKEIENKKFLHGPIAKGTCIPCHAPHGSGNPQLLAGKYPGSFYIPYTDDSYSFCFRCHQKLMLKYPDTTIYTGFRNGNYNLHYVHVSNQRKGRSCRACHEPHGSTLPKLISSQGPSFGEWNIPLSFVQTKDGGSCSPGCHRPFTYSRTKPVDYKNLSSAQVKPVLKNATSAAKEPLTNISTARKNNGGTK